MQAFRQHVGTNGYRSDIHSRTCTHLTFAVVPRRSSSCSSLRRSSPCSLPVLSLKPSFLSRRLQPALPLQRASSSREVFCTFVVAPCYVMNPGVTPACANADQTPRKVLFHALRPGQFNPSGFPSEKSFPLGKNNHCSFVIQSVTHTGRDESGQYPKNFLHRQGGEF